MGNLPAALEAYVLAIHATNLTRNPQFTKLIPDLWLGMSDALAKSGNIQRSIEACIRYGQSQREESPDFWYNKLTHFYMAYNPKKVDSVDQILLVYGNGRETELWSKLLRKYSALLPGVARHVVRLEDAHNDTVCEGKDFVETLSLILRQ